MPLTRLVRKICPDPVVRTAKFVRNLGRRAGTKLRVQALLRKQLPIQLELGSGSRPGLNGWTTVDVVPGCDLFCDLSRGIPFPGSSVQFIYSSHFFEHLTFKQAQALLAECRRVLVPGGKFSICVPNAKIYLDAYVKGVILDHDKFLIYEPADNKSTAIDYVNYMAYMDGQHRYMFDVENLVCVLQRGGLRDVRIRGFDASLDMAKRDFESIYAEGFK